MDEREARPFAPWRVLEVELSRPVPALTTLDVDAVQALVLVRLHDRPLGTLKVSWTGVGLSAAALAGRIWQELQTEIRAHLRDDHLPEPESLPVGGLVADAVPGCLAARAALLAHAPFISVVVATHDRPAGLAACLESLLAMQYPSYEIIVVDNAPSSPAAAAVVRDMQGRGVALHYVREEQPGLACAHNCGLRAVRGEIVAFTDDDVTVDPLWLAMIAEGFAGAEHVGCVTGLIVPTELETPAQVWIEQFGGFGKGYSQRVFDLDRHRVQSPLYPYAAGIFGSGANMAFQTALLQRLGGFDPALGAGSLARGGDDLAAFFAVIAAGHQLVYQPAAIVHHPHRREYAGLRTQMYGYGVGLAAYLTKVVVDRPSRALDLARRLPSGVRYAMSPTSVKNAGKGGDYPAELTWLERKGMLYGPVAYLRSRRQVTKARRAPMPTLASAGSYAGQEAVPGLARSDQ